MVASSKIFVLQLVYASYIVSKYPNQGLLDAGANVYRGGGEIAKLKVFHDKSRNRRFSATISEIDNFPRQIAI